MSHDAMPDDATGGAVSLDYRCEVCGAKRNEPCRNTINPGQPLPGRGEHFARVMPPGRTKPKGDS